MRFKMLDSVVLDRDLPEQGPCKGALGAVVEADELEVEFVTASGDTEAILSLNDSDVRPAESNDLISVRPIRRSA